MSLVLIILGCLILYIFLQTLYSGYYLKIGRELSKNTFSHPDQFGNKDNPPLKLFITGDSIAVGVGASSFETSVSGRIVDFLSKKYFLHYKNEAISGSRMKDVLILPLPAEKQDLIILIASSNDLFNFTSIDEFKTNTQKVIDRYLPLTKKLIVVGPGRVFDGQAVPFPFRIYYRYKAPYYSKVLEKITSVSSDIIYINPTGFPDEKKSLGSDNASDHFHPNDEGHLSWFNMIKLSLE